MSTDPRDVIGALAVKLSGRTSAELEIEFELRHLRLLRPGDVVHLVQKGAAVGLEDFSGDSPRRIALEGSEGVSLLLGEACELHVLFSGRHSRVEGTNMHQPVRKGRIVRISWRNEPGVPEGMNYRAVDIERVIVMRNYGAVADYLRRRGLRVLPFRMYTEPWRPGRAG